MYRKKQSIYRAWYYLWFQASIGSFGSYPREEFIQDKGVGCATVPSFAIVYSCFFTFLLITEMYYLPNGFTAIFFFLHTFPSKYST